MQSLRQIMQRNGGTNEAREPYKSVSGVWSSCKENGKPLQGAGVLRKGTWSDV